MPCLPKVTALAGVVMGKVVQITEEDFRKLRALGVPAMYDFGIADRTNNGFLWDDTVEDILSKQETGWWTDVNDLDCRKERHSTFRFYTLVDN